MAANHHFIANEYLRAFDLKEIFAKYAVYFASLHYPDEPLSSKDRHELTLKLEEAMNEMTLLVLKMKEPKSDLDKSEKAVSHSHVTLRKANECRMAN